MKIHNGQLYWPTTYTKKPHTNPGIKPLYDCIIVGGGMSGLLTAHALIEEGLSVAILEMKEAVKGSTAANTGLLQWTNDISLHELIELIGVEDAVRFHHLCQQALNDLEVLAKSMEDEADFVRRPSICFASQKKDAKKLQKEFDTLLEHGFPCEYWNDLIIKQRFGFDSAAALKTFNDAEFNPYKFGVQLLEQLIEKGLHLFEHTYVNIIEDHTGIITLKTLEKTFSSKKIIYTTGYHPLPYGKIKGTDINRTYAIVTNVIEDLSEWHEHALLWETARPYFYMRKTVDDRIVIGGLDESKSKAPKDATVEERAQELLDLLQQFTPQKNVTAVAFYGASFGESKDHLPFIGEHPEHPNHYYLLGYGGNGTVCSMLGAKILADLICGRKNDDARIVTINRKYGAI